MPYKVRLKAAHDETGKSPYQVSKSTGVAINTIVKYVEEDIVIAGQLSNAVPKLAQYYGLNWMDGYTVEWVESIDDEGIKRAPIPA